MVHTRKDNKQAGCQHVVIIWQPAMLHNENLIRSVALLLPAITGVA